MKVRLRATSSRCQRNKVSGVTIVPSSRSVLRPKALAFSARVRRSTSVKMMRQPPSRSGSRRFSTLRYSITADCCRCNQPATTSSRNCSRVVDAAISHQCWLLVPATSTGTAQPHRIPQARRSFATLRPQQPRKTGLRRSTIEVMPSCASTDPEMRASVNASSSSCDSRCAAPARRNKRLISP
jgi:hypothetical protein